MNDRTRLPSLGTMIAYRDPKAAIDWLEKAFGFETSLLVTDDAGNIAHSELRFGNGYIMVGGEWAGGEGMGGVTAKSPRSLGGANTQHVHVQMEAGIDAHCERARAAGATIIREPEDQSYGDRVYVALDPDGHAWSFGQTVRALSNTEMEGATGLKVKSS